MCTYTAGYCGGEYKTSDKLNRHINQQEAHFKCQWLDEFLRKSRGEEEMELGSEASFGKSLLENWRKKSTFCSISESENQKVIMKIWFFFKLPKKKGIFLFCWFVCSRFFNRFWPCKLAFKLNLIFEVSPVQSWLFCSFSASENLSTLCVCGEQKGEKGRTTRLPYFKLFFTW